MADNAQQLTLSDFYRDHIEDTQRIRNRIRESLEVQPAVDGDERLQTILALQAEIEEYEGKLTRAKAREGQGGNEQT